MLRSKITDFNGPINSYDHRMTNTGTLCQQSACISVLIQIYKLITLYLSVCMVCVFSDFHKTFKSPTDDSIFGTISKNDILFCFSLKHMEMLGFSGTRK